MDTESPVVWPAWCYSGETASTAEVLDVPQLHQVHKPVRRKRMDRSLANNTPTSAAMTAVSDMQNNNNNNNHVKSERLSPGTPDTSSRSRSVTPSPASHPNTPPASENPLMQAAVAGRNYSDIMRSLAAKYNNANPNDYFSAARNGLPPTLDPRFRPTTFPNLLPTLSTVPQNKENEPNNKKTDIPMLNPFVTGAAAIFPPLIDMSTTQALLAMSRTAKDANLQGMLRNMRRREASSPLDLSAAPTPPKRPTLRTPSSGSPNYGGSQQSLKRAESESPQLSEDISNWTVEDVTNFVSGIDICAEYAQIFQEQRIDGAGLPLLTEEHLTNTMKMKLGPALKLRSILAKKLGTCSVCLHCTHCHNSSGSPEPTNPTGNMSDSGGAS